MAEVSIPKFGSIALGVISFIRLVQGTIIAKFLEWFPFGWGWLVFFLNFIYAWYEVLAGAIVAIIFLKWTKNAYVLIFIAVMVWIFLKFGLKSIGG